MTRRRQKATHDLGWYIGVALAILLTAYLLTWVSMEIWQSAPTP